MSVKKIIPWKNLNLSYHMLVCLWTSQSQKHVLRTLFQIISTSCAVYDPDCKIVTFARFDQLYWKSTTKASFCCTTCFDIFRPCTVYFICFCVCFVYSLIHRLTHGLFITAVLLGGLYVVAPSFQMLIIFLRRHVSVFDENVWQMGLYVKKGRITISVQH